MLQMHKLSYYSVISFFLFCRDCPNAQISPEAMEIGATLRRDHGTPPQSSLEVNNLLQMEKKTTFFNSLASLSWIHIPKQMKINS